MKVAFWSSADKTGNATYNIAAIGIMLTMLYKCDVVLGSNYISNKMLQDCFSGKINEKGVSRLPFRLHCGAMDYYRELWEMKEKRQGDIMEIPMPGVTILYPPDVTDKKMFYYEVPHQTMYLMDVAGEHYLTSEKALVEAEFIVVFLPQDEVVIQTFFEQFAAFIPKSIIVLDNYRKNSKISLRSIELNYGMKRWKNAIIPYDIDFLDACETGRLESFLRENENCSTKNSHFYLMSNLLQITERLYEHNRKRGGVR